MGKNINCEIGKIYGCYKIIELLPIVKYEKRFCKCQCVKCGNIEIKRYSDVKFHKIKNCSQCPKEKKIDKQLIGKKFGKLTILGRGEDHEQPNGTKKVTVECVCDCGNKVTVQLYKLKTGRVNSCGCYHSEIVKKPRKDLTGKKFGKLTVLRKTTEDYGRTSWLCKCDCGNETVATTTALNLGLKKSCGCLISNAEYEFKKYLSENNYYFKTQYKINDCKDKRSLPFDFAIFNDKEMKKLKMLVELNGQQHYYPFTFNNEKKEIKNKNLIDRINKDKIKREYCKNNKIPLLEIKYSDFNKMYKIFENFIKLL